MRDASSASSNDRVFWIAGIAVVALDVITKRLAERLLTEHHPVPVLGDVGRLTLVYNKGAAFSMSLGSYNRYIFGAFAVIAVVILWRLYRQSAPRETRRVLALGLALGGATGNLIDRLRGAQGVVDFIDIGVGSIRFWTFNVADSAVTIGALLLAWVLWHEDREAVRRKAVAERARRDASTSREAGERTGT